MKFIKTYREVKFQGMDEPFMVTVISKGDTVEDIMGNAELILKDEFGDDGPARDLNEVSMSDYYMIQYDISEEYVNYMSDYYSRGH